MKLDPKIKEAIDDAIILLTKARSSSAAVQGALMSLQSIFKEEIPEGCPALFWNHAKQNAIESFYDSFDGRYHVSVAGDTYEYADIDYERPGHLIPWYGGPCPLQDGTKVTVFRRDETCPEYTYVIGTQSYSWEKSDRDSAVMSYMIWPQE